MNIKRKIQNIHTIDSCNRFSSITFGFGVFLESGGYLGTDRMMSGSIPSAKHFSRRQVEQKLRVFLVIEQLFLNWHFVRDQIVILTGNVFLLNNDKVTFLRYAFLRKKFLQDMQVLTLKLRPRATSPHIRQFIDERDSWLLGLLFFSILVLIVFLRQVN